MAAGETSPNSKDDINLVDLAVTLVRNRRLFYLVFTLVVLAGVAYALVAPVEYEYTSLLEVPGTRVAGVREPLETTANTVAILENEWIPESQADYHAEAAGELPFEVWVSGPKDTMLVRIVSVADQADAPLVERVHEKLLGQIKDHQTQLVKDRRRTLEREIASADGLLDGLSGEALAVIVEKKANGVEKLESLTLPQTIVTARESVKRVSFHGFVVVAMSVLLGLIFGIFTALIARFVRAVRSQLAT